MAKRTGTTRYLLAGVAFFLLGIQLRLAESVVLRPEVTRVLAGWRHAGDPSPTAAMRQMIIDGTGPRKIITPPGWLGWACLSVGVILTVRSSLPGGGKKSAK